MWSCERGEPMQLYIMNIVVATDVIKMGRPIIFKLTLSLIINLMCDPV